MTNVPKKMMSQHTGVQVIEKKTKTIELNAWDLIAIEEALGQGLAHIDAESLDRLRRKISAAISGSLVVSKDFK